MATTNYEQLKRAGGMVKESIDSKHERQAKELADRLLGKKPSEDSGLEECNEDDQTGSSGNDSSSVGAFFKSIAVIVVIGAIYIGSVKKETTSENAPTPAPAAETAETANNNSANSKTSKTGIVIDEEVLKMAENGDFVYQKIVYEKYLEAMDSNPEYRENIIYWLQKMIDGGAADGYRLVADNFFHFGRHGVFGRDYEKAIKFYNLAIDQCVEPRDIAEIKYRIGMSYEKLGQVEQGLNLIREAAQNGSLGAQNHLRSN